MSFHDALYSQEINFETALLRLVFSFMAGMLIGIEREAHSQPAGMRTHILISIGSTLAMLLSIYIPQTYMQFQNGDPGRIAAQVVTGIGFLGAGAILRLGVNVKGLTTAASIWAMAMLGLGFAGLAALRRQLDPPQARRRAGVVPIEVGRVLLVGLRPEQRESQCRLAHLPGPAHERHLPCRQRLLDRRGEVPGDVHGLECSPVCS